MNLRWRNFSNFICIYCARIHSVSFEMYDFLPFFSEPILENSAKLWRDSTRTWAYFENAHGQTMS